MSDWATRTVKAIGWVAQYRERNRTAHQLTSRAHARAVRPSRFHPPRRIERMCTVSSELRDGQRIYRLMPHPSGAPRVAGEPASHGTASHGTASHGTASHGTAAADRPALLFLHGGGYVNEMLSAHWVVAATLCAELKRQVIVPIYPLAPLGNAADNYQRMVALYRRECERVGPPDVIGDSAGGGMALALLLQVVQAGLPLPDRCVLHSPWLDLTCANPDVVARAKLDVMLSPTMLESASRLWAGDLPLEDPQVSPLFGDLAALAPTRFLVLTGTHDILNADSRAFRDRAQELGLQVVFLEDEEQPHVFAFLPTRQGRAAKRRIESFLLGDPAPGRDADPRIASRRAFRRASRLLD